MLVYPDKSSLMVALPPEIFHHVASHIPLQYFPATLSALALTAKEINRNVTAILYSKVVLRNKDQAHDMLDRIGEDKELGLMIRELHILTNDMAFRWDKKRSLRLKDTTPLIKRLNNAIKDNLLPRLTRFSLALFRQHSSFKTTTRDSKTYSSVPKEFWTDLERFCPRLRGVFFRESGGGEEEDPQMLYELTESVTPQAEHANGLDITPTDLDLHLARKPMPDLARSLKSIHFFPRMWYLDIDPLFSNTFPVLESFTVSRGSLRKASKAMEFWARHPRLERLSLCTLDDSVQWFTDDVEPGLLPRLTHLKATFKNVRALASHLGQLQHLSITQSLNCQVGYLLRSVIPEGLPDLKSLEVNQRRTSDMSEEGTMWYEYTSGEIVEHTCKRESIQPIPIHSIVRGAPNVEELCLRGDPKDRFTSFPRSRFMSQFNCLERIYFQAFQKPRGKLKEYDISSFASTCESIATSCKMLRLVTDVSIMESGRYLTGKIIRDSDGLVTEVVTGRGFGMEFTGGDDDPFPHNPLVEA